MATTFRHEALLYDGEVGILTGTLPFIREGVAAGEPVLVVVSAARIGLLRSVLGGDADRVAFADMADVGANPARIIPAWRSGPTCWRRPVGATRSSASAGSPGRAPATAAWSRRPSRSRPRCPTRPGDRPSSASARDRWPTCVSWCRGARPPPGSTPAAAPDLVQAVDELATNSLRHGGGRGTLRIWRDAGALVCEVRDAGRLEDPMAGRERPPPERDGGRGLWMVNQLCDLVQLRSFPDGAAVRVHMYLP